MTDLSPLAYALHKPVWPFVAEKARNTTETIEDENVFMNDAVERYAPSLVNTPPDVLGLVWGIHPLEAARWRDGIQAALAAADRPGATKQNVLNAYEAIAA